MKLNQARNDRAAYLFILPNLIGFLVFTSIPVLASFVMSFLRWDLFTSPEMAGLSNYAALLHDKDFWFYTGNTVFLMMGIPIGMALSLALAIAMNRKLRGIVLFRTIYFMPTLSAGVAILLLWRWIYNPDYGLLNTLFTLCLSRFSEFAEKFGLHINLRPPYWLGPGWAKPSLILMNLWIGIGGPNMILYLAALQGIPPQLYEAATIDGAGNWQKFRHVTLPMLRPTTFFIAVMGLIYGFQGGFEQAYVMTGGGPAGQTTTISYYIYNNAFVWHKMGYACAAAWLLFVFVFTLALLNWRFAREKVRF